METIDAEKFLNELHRLSEALSQQSRSPVYDNGTKTALAAAHYTLAAIVTAGRSALEAQGGE